jgi:hypothetical protein
LDRDSHPWAWADGLVVRDAQQEQHRLLVCLFAVDPVAADEFFAAELPEAAGQQSVAPALARRVVVERETQMVSELGQVQPGSQAPLASPQLVLSEPPQARVQPAQERERWTTNSVVPLVQWQGAPQGSLEPAAQSELTRVSE